MGWQKRAMVAIALAPALMFSAGAVVPGVSKPSAESVAARSGEPAPHDDTVERGPHAFESLRRLLSSFPFARSPSRA
jgi:hypothetical protein